MKILGIHDGHNSGATLLINGEITASVTEERLTRVKNESGYPKLSIDEVLKISKLSPDDLDCVVYSSNFMHTKSHLSNISDWYRVGLEEQKRDKLKDRSYLKTVFDNRKSERIDTVVSHLKIDKNIIKFKEHHLCHAASAFYGSHYDFDESILVLTADGAGDGLSSTVSISKGNKIERLTQTDRKASLGKIYSRITFLLGLKPWEHEYKVMGLAPYGDESRAEKLIEIFENLLDIDDESLEFSLKSEIETNYSYFYFREKLERARFDEVSYAVQKYTEKILKKWVTNCVKKTGIKKIACGGGVFMNVKANQIISEINEIEDIYVFPSCGDDSLSFGAVWLEYYENHNKKIDFENIYLGRGFTDIEIEKDLKLNNSEIIIEKFEDINSKIAELLFQNNIVARFNDRMEWGARALGNRSILANPSNWENVETINNMIKKRDFWMPFAPSMLAEYADQLILNPKKLKSPFMMLAFDTLEKNKIKAAVHPRDNSTRAQLVEKQKNPEYHDLIKKFYKLTNIPAVLNTSFNLHGYPLVYSPKDAIFVFENSGLNYLVLNNYLVSKK